MLPYITYMDPMGIVAVVSGFIKDGTVEIV
jgi:hypothetical protein